MLTPRQAEIAELVAQGLSTKQIAREIGVSPATVKSHIGDAARRLPGPNCRPRYKLMLWFFSELDA